MDTSLILVSVNKMIEGEMGKVSMKVFRMDCLPCEEIPRQLRCTTLEVATGEGERCVCGKRGELRLTVGGLYVLWLAARAVQAVEVSLEGVGVGVVAVAVTVAVDHSVEDFVHSVVHTGHGRHVHGHSRSSGSCCVTGRGRSHRLHGGEGRSRVGAVEGRGVSLDDGEFPLLCQLCFHLCFHLELVAEGCTTGEGRLLLIRELVCRACGLCRRTVVVQELLARFRL